MLVSIGKPRQRLLSANRRRKDRACSRSAFWNWRRRIRSPSCPITGPCLPGSIRNWNAPNAMSVLALSCSSTSIISKRSMMAMGIQLAGRLHDVGKVAIPDGVLQKAGRLTEEEWDLIRTHPLVGAEVVSPIPALRPLAPVIRAHHERWDGQGYPDQLAGEAIPFGARILMVVDAYLAIIVDRPYRQARAPAVALAELRRCTRSQFDPQV